MSSRNWLLLSCVLIGIVAFSGRPNAQAPAAAFHAVGDLPGPGGVGSAVRDATRVGGTIYAVGASTVNATATLPNVPNLDTPALWTWPGSGTGTLEALPNTAVFANTQTDSKTAYAITPSGAYIASQARPSNGPGTNWVRVDRSLLPNMTANLNLSAALGTPAFAALAISDNGGVIYGQRQNGTGGFPTETRVPVRYEPGVGFNFPDLTPTGKAWGFPIPRGTSTDGLVMVGAASDGAVVRTGLGTNAVAFRYEHNDGMLTGTTTLIPVLPDGTWNMPVALSSDGSQTLVIGDSTDYANGEVYLTNAANAITATLGSPNTALLPRALGGMTADGSVVAVTFASGFFGPGQIGGLGIPTSNKYAYIHNSHGWFHFSSILRTQGIDLEALGWDSANLAITGIRTVEGVDLVFGQGRHNDNVEGFVAEFGAGVLANFNPLPAPPADTSIVGVWTLDGDPSAPNAVGVFTANGAYYLIEGNGFEWGYYTFDGSDLTITTRLDTNGSGGLSDTNGVRQGPLTINGDTLTAGDESLYRIAGGPGSIVGGWVGGDPTQPDNTFVAVFADNAYFTAQDFPDGDGAETGTYTWDPASHELIATPTGGVPDAQNFVTIAADGLSVFVVDDGGETFTLNRVIDPATIPVITSALSASGVAGQAFSYGVTGTNAVTFGATGLPDGLSLSSTGEISGTPGVGGQFAVTISATNAIGVSDIETLTLTIAIPTPVGENVVVEAEVPEGQGPVTLSFAEVTTAGTTTVTILDQSEVPAPGNVAIGGVVYEVTTTATYQGLITLCFSYAGIDFGAATPRLFHYENNVWVDITTSVGPDTQTICGATTTLSPFAVLVSNVVRTGFYAPLNPIAGFLNTAKGGATVPLKFNVFVNGVEQRTTAGLEMTMQWISCDSNAPEDDVEPAAVTGRTSLRYDAAAGHFIQNWKVPKTPGRCYMVRMTTTQDGLALTARFKVR